MDFEYELYPNTDIYILKINQDLHLPKYILKFSNSISNLLNEDPQKIILNIEKKDFRTQSRGVGEIFSLYSKLNGVKQNMRFVHTPQHADDSFSRIIKINKMDQIFKIYNSLEEAINSFDG